MRLSISQKNFTEFDLIWKTIPFGTHWNLTLQICSWHCIYSQAVSVVEVLIYIAQFPFLKRDTCLGALWDFHYAAKGTKLCTTLKAGVKHGVRTRGGCRCGQSVIRKPTQSTHSGDFVRVLAAFRLCCSMFPLGLKQCGRCDCCCCIVRKNCSHTSSARSSKVTIKNEMWSCLRKSL